MKIELTQEQVALIERHLSGKYNPFFASKEEQEMMNDIIDNATALEDELNAIDERMEEPNCDLLSWYLKKYREQSQA